MFCVYIIFSRKLNRYYVGTTDDFVKRLAEHNDIKHLRIFYITRNSLGILPINWMIFIANKSIKSKNTLKICTQKIYSEFGNDTELIEG
ncbi:MAG: GIY-YIG nuclease family protein [Bacteroidetes bacterium]|nr:GIY-YIG nuclease family protein [Bacteroidota bacterium]